MSLNISVLAIAAIGLAALAYFQLFKRGRVEKEHKFVLRGVTPDHMPHHARKVGIEQSYLISFNPDVERRVRVETLQNGEKVYTYTIKQPTGKRGERTEQEKVISLQRYQELMRERNLSLITIRKTRYTFHFQGHKLEVDFYKDPYDFLAILEVEVRNMKHQLVLPGWEKTDVTGQKSYSNYALAQGSLLGDMTGS